MPKNPSLSPQRAQSKTEKPFHRTDKQVRAGMKRAALSLGDMHTVSSLEKEGMSREDAFRKVVAVPGAHQKTTKNPRQSLSSGFGIPISVTRKKPRSGNINQNRLLKKLEENR